jgi:hypothetical protein
MRFLLCVRDRSAVSPGRNSLHPSARLPQGQVTRWLHSNLSSEPLAVIANRISDFARFDRFILSAPPGLPCKSEMPAQLETNLLRSSFRLALKTHNQKRRTENRQLNTENSSLRPVSYPLPVLWYGRTMDARGTYCQDAIEAGIRNFKCHSGWEKGALK